MRVFCCASRPPPSFRLRMSPRLLLASETHQQGHDGMGAGAFRGNTDLNGQHMAHAPKKGCIHLSKLHSMGSLYQTHARSDVFQLCPVFSLPCQREKFRLSPIFLGPAMSAQARVSWHCHEAEQITQLTCYLAVCA